MISYSAFIRMRNALEEIAEEIFKEKNHHIDFTGLVIEPILKPQGITIWVHRDDDTFDWISSEPGFENGHYNPVSVEEIMQRFTSESYAF